MHNLDTCIEKKIESTSISTRRELRGILREFNSDTSCVHYDFSEVEFISRTAAHELFLLFNESKTLEKEIKFYHFTTEVKKMIKIVVGSFNKMNQNNKFLNHLDYITFENSKDRANYLSSL